MRSKNLNVIFDEVFDEIVDKVQNIESTLMRFI